MYPGSVQGQPWPEVVIGRDTSVFSGGEVTALGRPTCSINTTHTRHQHHQHGVSNPLHLDGNHQDKSPLTACARCYQEKEKHIIVSCCIMYSYIVYNNKKKGTDYLFQPQKNIEKLLILG